MIAGEVELPMMLSSVYSDIIVVISRGSMGAAQVVYDKCTTVYNRVYNSKVSSVLSTCSILGVLSQVL